MTTTRPGQRYTLGFKIAGSKGPVLASRWGRYWGSVEEAASAARDADRYSIPSVLVNCVVDARDNVVAWVSDQGAGRISVGDPVEYVGQRAVAKEGIA